LPLALKAVELNRTNQNTLGVVYYRLGQWQKAIESLEAGLRANAGEAGAAELFFLAVSHQRLGDAARANDYFAKAVKWMNEQRLLSPESKGELDAFRVEAEEVLGIAKDK
jgi:tetratricopeptide (TPR) repeat protein